MALIRQKTNNQNRYFLSAILLWNLLLALSCYRYGIGLSTDSANYVSAAKNLVQEGTLMQFDDSYLQNAPPFYSYLLSLAFILKIQVFTWALLLNFLALNVVFFCWKKIADSVTGQGYFYLFALTPYWLFSHGFMMLLSEGIFMAMLSALIYVMDRQGKAINTFGAILLALLCLTRYTGLMMLPGIILFLIWKKNTLKDVLLFLLPTILSMGLWFYRNYTLSGHTLGAHLLTQKYGLTDLGLLLPKLLMLALLLFGGLKLREKVKPMFLNSTLVLIAFLCASYLTLLFCQQGISRLQMPRYLSVVEIPLFFLLGALLMGSVRNEKYLRLVFGLVFMLKLLLLSQKTVFNFKEGAGGFHSKPWQDQALQNTLIHAHGTHWISNYPDHVYWITGNRCRYGPYVNESRADLNARIEVYGSFVYFNFPNRNHVMETWEKAEKHFTYTSKEWSHDGNILLGSYRLSETR